MREGAVSRRNWATEVGDRVLLLDEHRTKVMCGRVTLDDEWLVKVLQG